ncbi:hydantoinase/oxoprolinase family protein [Maritimibacter alkaliphilus]|uniref:hydantoinase/oxoprolinase family protein n=1 Tax=Maritimibacter alkaliphilus TaxID=404236 RepID=UPI001C981EAB|nr:hydantoinase/oxoprolinase family protein [Maritimibacter alkaliphilus]MBY6092023.1 hydantoinase/oxoprolinase family protein [Maritimibacter alkaliphilus]
MGYRVGVDIGGTFADFCAFDETAGSMGTVKVLTTPDKPGQEVIDGLKALEDRFGIAPGDISYFTHGTTVGINSIIMRKGIRLAMFTTENFCDVLELARLKMPDPYHLLSSRPEPLVTRDLVFGVAERMLADGTVDSPLDEDSLRAAVAAAKARGAEGVVISFLHSYRNPAHEQQAKRLIAEIAPELHVFTSHEVRPIIREYERSSTAVIHGYVQPRVSQYLGALQEALSGIGVTPEPMITKSNGGIMSVEVGKTACVEMLLSGTAAGVMGAAFVAREAGEDKVLSLDIGGTSADVAIITGGQPGYGMNEVVGDFPIFVPTVSVTSIGEGGGSIARIDAAGMLTVGPDSAGSTPGPAAYGRGGTQATITDAFVTLGLLDLSALGYGMVSVDRDKAVEVIQPLADSLGSTLEETAEGIVGIAVSGMFREVSKLCSRRGIDVGEFSLLAFGGGGPMMACFLARDLGMKRVIVPPSPGVLSALGGLTADVRNDFTETAYYDLAPANAPRMGETIARLTEKARRWMVEEQHYEGRPVFHASGEMRYRGQSFEIEVPIDPATLAKGDITPVAEAFHAEHRRLYGHADPEAPIQIIAINLVVTGHSAKPTLPRSTPQPKTVTAQASMSAWLDGARREVPLFKRNDLTPGATFVSPCVIAQDDTTTIVPAGFSGEVDGHGNLILTLAETADAH